MKLKPMAFAVVFLTAVLCLLEGRYEHADSDLSTFYS